MHDHIKAVAGRYAGRIDAWDVVNEVVDNDGILQANKMGKKVSEMVMIL